MNTEIYHQKITNGQFIFSAAKNRTTPLTRRVVYDKRPCIII